MNPITYRRANSADVEFIATAIFAADQSGTSKSAYCALFQLDENEFKEVIKSVLDMELEDCEFSLAAFCIAESSGVPAGASAAWIEGAQGIPSWQMKFTAFRYILPPEALHAFHQMQARVQGIMPERTKGNLQIESVFVVDAFRGQGLVEGMIQQHAQWHEMASKPESKMELIAYDNNERAINAYEKLGFQVVSRSKRSDSEIGEIYPSDGMVQMQKR